MAHFVVICAVKYSLDRDKVAHNVTRHQTKASLDKVV